MGLTEIEEGGTECQTEQNEVVDFEHLRIIHIPEQHEFHACPIHHGYIISTATPRRGDRESGRAYLGA